jgi:hypothetical protein
MEKARRQFLKGVRIAAIGVTAISGLPVLKSCAFADGTGKGDKSCRPTD